jgi:hypothetical protein
MPCTNRDLPGDNRAGFVITIVEQFKKGKTVIGIQWGETEVINGAPLKTASESDQG